MPPKRETSWKTKFNFIEKRYLDKQKCGLQFDINTPSSLLQNKRQQTYLNLQFDEEMTPLKKALVGGMEMRKLVSLKNAI